MLGNETASQGVSHPQAKPSSRSVESTDWREDTVEAFRHFTSLIADESASMNGESCVNDSTLSIRTISQITGSSSGRSSDSALTESDTTSPEKDLSECDSSLEVRIKRPRFTAGGGEQDEENPLDGQESGSDDRSMSNGKEKITPGGTSSSNTEEEANNRRHCSINEVEESVKAIENVPETNSIIRKKCVREFREAMKAANEQVLALLFKKYCRADVLSWYKFIGSSCPHSISEIMLSGRESVELWWTSIFRCIPDILFQFVDEPIYQEESKRKTSCTSMKFRVNGTKFFEVEEVLLDNFDKSVIRKKVNSSLARSCKKEIPPLISVSNTEVSMVSGGNSRSNSTEATSMSVSRTKWPIFSNIFRMEKNVSVDEEGQLNFHFDHNDKVCKIEVFVRRRSSNRK